MAQGKEATKKRTIQNKPASSIIRNAEGRRRVIITKVSPQVERGHFPAKTVVGEETVISADIFSDGHDVVTAAVLVKHEKERQWKEVSMKHLGNDRW